MSLYLHPRNAKLTHLSIITINTMFVINYIIYRTTYNLVNYVKQIIVHICISAIDAAKLMIILLNILYIGYKSLCNLYYFVILDMLLKYDAVSGCD